MRLLIDANVFYDVLARRDEFHDTSRAVLRFCEDGRGDGFVSALTAANLHYMGCKLIGREKTDAALKSILQVFGVAGLTASDLKKALNKKGDFEDALQMSAAERVKADLIITRDLKHFAGGRIKALSPADFCKEFCG